MEAVVQKQRLIGDKESRRMINKNMILFLFGKLVSLFGSSIYSFAMGLYILQVTGSALNFAVTIVIGSVPRAVLNPIAGVVVDKFDRKKMTVILDILSGIIVLALVGLSWINGLKIGYIYATTLLLNIANVFFNNAISASIPNLVDDESLTKINSISSTIQQASYVLGPVLGGLIFGIMDIKLFLVINGVSFVLSGISEIFIDFKVKDKIYGEQEKADKQVEKSGFRADFMEGMRYIVSQKWLVVLGISVTFSNMLFTIGFNVPIPYIASEIWNVSKLEFGFLMAAYPIGMAIGSVVVGLIPQSEKNFKRIIVSLFTFGLGSMVVGIITSDITMAWANIGKLGVLMSMFSGIAFASAFLNIPLMVTFQKMIPNELLGRVMGVFFSMAALMMPVGALISGYLVDIVTPWKIPFASGVLMILLTLVLAKNKELKEI